MFYSDTKEALLLLNHTLIQDKYTGDYNVTVYLSLQRHDPLLLASLLSYTVTLFSFGILASNELFISNNVVRILYILLLKQVLYAYVRKLICYSTLTHAFKA